MSIIQKVVKDYYMTHTYSGRGMNNRECLGVELSEFSNLGSFLHVVIIGTVNLEESEVIDLAEEILCLRTDSLGKGMIVYFPDVEHEENIVGR